MMKPIKPHLSDQLTISSLIKKIALFLTAVAALLCLSGCSLGRPDRLSQEADASDARTAHFLRITGQEPDTGDPQCTSEEFDIALNVFDRLIEIELDEERTPSFVPSLAKSWEISEDGLVYTFHLCEDVVFSNGSPLTASDVEYTLIRALTHPDSECEDIGIFIVGAEELQAGKAEQLVGFNALSDLDFTLTLTEPNAALLATLSTPCASILDAETTTQAGDAFGIDPTVTIGTGPFIFSEWNHGTDLTLTANPDCWSGAPGCDGILMQFVTDSEAKRLMFEDGRLDILDLEELGPDAEYFMHGDIYQDQLSHGTRVGLSYIALNESIQPLDDVRIRRALQLALDRRAILMNIYSGRGSIENGIFPHGLIGYNPDLPEIPYDPEAARTLLAEAGYPAGFDLVITANAETPSLTEIMRLAAYMWEQIGVHATIEEMSRDDFLTLRKNGRIACYAGKFSVDYYDPDSMIYIFFGELANSRSRSLYYEREEIIDRVYSACNITDEDSRIKEYQELERIIVHEDCAWIPLFSNEHYFVVSERVKNFEVSWNGWTNTKYRDVVINPVE